MTTLRRLAIALDRQSGQPAPPGVRITVSKPVCGLFAGR
jgi:hypothetical protein